MTAISLKKSLKLVNTVFPKIKIVFQLCKVKKEQMKEINLLNFKLCTAVSNNKNEYFILIYNINMQVVIYILCVFNLLREGSLAHGYFALEGCKHNPEGTY